MTVLGGVPAGRIRYDNLKAAVAQVIGFSRQRVEADRWVAFRSHFDVDTFYCQPGITGAFPREKSMRPFDYAANPNLDPAVINALATCDWVRKGQPLCLLGDSGTGKGHLLIALGTEAAMAGFRVKYTLAAKLVNELVEAADEMTLTKTIARYGRVDLPCIDELG